MKKIWKKVVKIFAWIGAGLLAVLALAGTVLLARRRKPNEPDPLITSFETGKKLAAAQQEAEDLERDLAIEKVKNAVKEESNDLKKDPKALADALNKLSEPPRKS